mgnify:CR=1 FL=1
MKATPGLPNKIYLANKHYSGTLIYEVTDTIDPDFTEKYMTVSFRYRFLDKFMQEWQFREKQLFYGEITKKKYQEWKLNRPRTTVARRDRIRN